MPRPRNGPAKPLTILQANVGRGATAHEIALSLANSSFIDIILIQEPYIFSDRSRKISKAHPMYESFTPLDDWTTRPRVMSYVRRGSGLHANQLRPVTTRDLIFLQIQARNAPGITIINAYNAPPGSTNPGEAINALVKLPPNLLTSTFLAGDFNLLHPRWDLYTTCTSLNTEPFIEWLDNNYFALASENGISTHSKGNVLDLAFITGPLTASTTLAQYLDCTSDHIPLLININWNARFPGLTKRLRVDTLDHKLFTALLSENCKALCPLPTSPTAIDLDQAASDLTQAISKAFNGSAKRTLGQNTGNPWWNKDCLEAVKAHKSAQSPTTARNLRNTVRKAKKQFWEKKLDTVQEIKDVFQMTKWHESTGAYRSPPFADPQNPHLGLAAGIEEKRDILLRKLLTNSAEVGDIPFDSPTAATCKIDFPPVTVTDIRKSILGAGNTTPGLDEIPTAVLKTA